MMTTVAALVAALLAVICIVLLFLQYDYVQCIRRIARLEAQRDRAWRALSEIEDALADGPSVERLAWIVAGSRRASDCEEFNAVVATVEDERTG